MKVIPCIGSNLSFENQELSTRTCGDRFGIQTFIERNATITGFSVTTIPYGTITIDWGDNKPDDIVNSGVPISHNYGIGATTLPATPPGGTVGGGTIGGGTIGGGITGGGLLGP